MRGSESTRHFESLALPHVDAAYNLARWLVHNDQDANDVVQEAYLHAQRCFASFRGDDMRPWLLQIVHHASHSWLNAGRTVDPVDHHESSYTRLSFARLSDKSCRDAAGKAIKGQINAAIAALPVALREVLVLRELEDMTYSDVARIVDVPVGTVMSRLSHARETVRESLTGPTQRSTLAPALGSA